MKFVITVNDAGLNHPPETERRYLDFNPRNLVHLYGQYSGPRIWPDRVFP